MLEDSRKYKDYYFLECDTVQLGANFLAFQRNLLPPPLGYKRKAVEFLRKTAKFLPDCMVSYARQR
jgi:hypothetical protein